MGLPRVEEVFETRAPKLPATIARVSGVVASIESDGTEKIVTLIADAELAEGKKKTARGIKKEIEYRIHPLRTLTVKVGSVVTKGDFMTDGSADLDDYFEFAGKEKAQEYVINEITRIYELQGVSTGRKHLEIIVKQMFSRINITYAGDTGVSVGDIVADFEFDRINKIAKDAGKEIARGRQLLLGITETSLTRASFLSSISFQNTPRKLAEASVSGAIDRLVGLKENVIIGRLIPAGTGFPGSKKFAMVEEMERNLAATSTPTASVEE